MAEEESQSQQPASQQPPAQPSKPSKGYGKRPVWQWVVIYIIAAVIIYGLIYLIFIHKSGSGGY